MFGKQPAAPSGAASQVQVYNTTQLVPSQYTVVERLWIDGWRSNLTYPTYRSVEDGIEAMREKAANAGANGLLNVMCMDATGYSNRRLLCYGDAIKFN
jgi:uncharacterized protein YbjQ (UPF0145 family)